MLELDKVMGMFEQAEKEKCDLITKIQNLERIDAGKDGFHVIHQQDAQASDEEEDMAGSDQ